MRSNDRYSQSALRYLSDPETELSHKTKMVLIASQPKMGIIGFRPLGGMKDEV